MLHCASECAMIPLVEGHSYKCHAGWNSVHLRLRPSTSRHGSTGGRNSAIYTASAGGDDSPHQRSNFPSVGGAREAVSNLLRPYQLSKIAPSVVIEDGIIYYPLVSLVDYFYEGKTDPRDAWKNIKRRLKREGFELVSNLHQFKIAAADGKQRTTDFADLENCLRIIMSIDSTKAEPVKRFMAQCAAEKFRSMDWDASMIHARLDEAGLLLPDENDNQHTYWWLK